MDPEEQRRLDAEELGINLDDLTLEPTQKDLEQLKNPSVIKQTMSPSKETDSFISQPLLLTQMNQLVSPATKSQIRRQTYNQFKKHDPRERGMSRRFSEAVTA